MNPTTFNHYPSYRAATCNKQNQQIGFNDLVKFMILMHCRQLHSLWKQSHQKWLRNLLWPSLKVMPATAQLRCKLMRGSMLKISFYLRAWLLMSCSMFKKKKNPGLLHLMTVGLFLSTHREYSDKRLAVYVYGYPTENLSEWIVARSQKREIKAFFLCVNFIFTMKKLTNFCNVGYQWEQPWMHTSVDDWRYYRHCILHRTCDIFFYFCWFYYIKLFQRGGKTSW